MKGIAHNGAVDGRSRSWSVVRFSTAVFAVVLTAQLALVAVAGTDIPFHDQWDVEGRRLYPAWRDGSWTVGYFFKAHNEHRILWTKALDVVLLSVNGQWDPLVQLVVGAVLRALVAAGLAYMLAMGTCSGGKGRALVAVGVAIAFLPQLAWHNALWGFQSQVYFSLGFSLVALWLMGAEGVAGRRRWIGLAAGGAGLLAMGAAALVPVALIGLVALRVIERRKWDRQRWGEFWPAGVLLLVALALRVEVPEHAVLQATSVVQWGEAWLRALAWPQVWQPIVAWVVNLPLVWAVGSRLAGRRSAARGEDFVILLGGWAVAMVAAMAWSRGGSGEFIGAVPSRYADFLVLLPLANGWCAVVLCKQAMAARPKRARLMATGAVAWGAFLMVGWLGLSSEMMQRIVLPRARDREAPVRLMQAYQRSGDPAFFSGQPRLIVPHPNPESVRIVLADERMRGALPPSLQPDAPLGVLSRATRWLLGR